MLSLQGRLLSVSVNDWEVRLVIQDITPRLDLEALDALHDKTVAIVVVSAKAVSS
jgi:hypothetical protein